MLDDAVEDPFALRRVVVEHGAGPQASRPSRRRPRSRSLRTREDGIVAAIAHRLLAHEDPASRSQRLRPRRERAPGSRRCPSSSRAYTTSAGSSNGCVTSATANAASGTRVRGLGDHRFGRVEPRDLRERERVAQQRRRVARTAAEVEDVARRRCAGGRASSARVGASNVSATSARRSRASSESPKAYVAQPLTPSRGRREQRAQQHDAVGGAEDGSEARSGCGMRPTTLRPSLQMPAMSSRLPFGLST